MNIKSTFGDVIILRLSGLLIEYLALCFGDIPVPYYSEFCT